MHTIVNTPSVFSCKLPAAGWINLAQIRQIQFEDMPTRVAAVTWQNGDHQTFHGEDAVTLIQSWEDATGLLEQRCNYRAKNRRTQ
ncbi:hypothetical protein H6G80_03205 [Nostoc sp. FACHB-87]|uniref:hypothetical protein n=1 Tax=Nostocaceae TaxID=1162 RepID=UPI001682D302|nr:MULTISPECIES: hypothetical protein [Nostocaceae]MBD2416072.1 hypothetical protein [Nostoc calcicola FACHB-3891]MBD2453082.1 hypothetical protein [Nostoc sp. FACHB-87]MBD2475138.1 hypothetical protein [Anabaena sp. FACHB-83]